MSHLTGRSSPSANSLTPESCTGVVLGDSGVREVGVSPPSLGSEDVQANATTANEHAAINGLKFGQP